MVASARIVPTEFENSTCASQIGVCIRRARLLQVPDRRVQTEDRCREVDERAECVARVGESHNVANHDFVVPQFLSIQFPLVNDS